MIGINWLKCAYQYSDSQYVVKLSPAIETATLALNKFTMYSLLSKFTTLAYVFYMCNICIPCY